jgi:hypothetical protein
MHWLSIILLAYYTLMHSFSFYKYRQDAAVALWDDQAEAFCPFQTGWYMDMATKDPVNFLFVATTSRLFQGIQLYSCQCYPGSVYFTV